MDVFLDPQFDSIFRRYPLVLADAGARGGLKSNWAAARPHLRVIGFEPDKREFERLLSAGAGDGTTLFGVALHNRQGPLKLHLARDRGLSSMFEPNRGFLDHFPEASRFDITDTQQVEADTLDNLLGSRGITEVDFIKADTQGSELYVLQGAAGLLAATVVGVEVEVEFTPLYKGQPLFADVDGLLRGLGFHLFDLRPCYWKRTGGRAIGGPRGQIVWADALYLKSLPALLQTLPAREPQWQKAKILKAISIALLYGYCDYALELARESGTALDAGERRAIEKRLRESAVRRGPLSRLPGRRRLTAALHRLWKMSLQPDESWSVSAARLGNLS